MKKLVLGAGSTGGIAFAMADMGSGAMALKRAKTTGMIDTGDDGIAEVASASSIAITHASVDTIA